jgi:hypothetical protein
MACFHVLSGADGRAADGSSAVHLGWGASTAGATFAERGRCLPPLATLDETGAPRIAAEALLELALLLPPTGTHPDPLALLDEAAALFADMPIPEREARCIEAMGDVLAARGDPASRNRYIEAKATYERFGLGLRVPLLARKIGAVATGG